MSLAPLAVDEAPEIVVTDKNTGESTTYKGWQAVQPQGGAWWQTPEAFTYGGSLSYLQSLIVSLKSGKPLAIAQSAFGLAAHLSRHVQTDKNGDIIRDKNGNPLFDSGDVALGTVTNLLGIISSIRGLKSALDRGDMEAAEIKLDNSMREQAAANDQAWRMVA